SPRVTTRSRRHSIWIGDSATRAGRTRRLGRGVSPATPNSFTSGGHSPEARFIRSARSSLTTLITSSPVWAAFAAVSLRLPSARRPMLTWTMGGSGARTLKKLNGARLGTPSAEGRDEGDRPRHHAADEQLVDVGRAHRRDVELHGPLPAGWPLRGARHQYRGSRCRGAAECGRMA